MHLPLTGIVRSLQALSLQNSRMTSRAQRGYIYPIFDVPEHVQPVNTARVA